MSGDFNTCNPMFSPAHFRCCQGDMAAMQDDMEKIRREKDSEIDSIMQEYEAKLRETVEEVRNTCNQEKEVRH